MTKPFLVTLNTIVHFTPAVVITLTIFEAMTLAVFGFPRTTWDVVQHLIVFEVVSGIYIAALIATLKPVETGGTARKLTNDDILIIVGFSVLFVAMIAAAMTFSSIYPSESFAFCGIAIFLLILFLAFGYFIIKDER